ncbi:hypothetical protein [Nostoc sp. KVJ3]|nr:hypothetical protein [Nostoc sp. KVJ3]
MFDKTLKLPDFSSLLDAIAQLYDPTICHLNKARLAVGVDI